jgi:pteridine reductase
MKNNEPVVLITGAAKRIGASIARALHARGYRIIIHYCHSQESAESLIAELNQQRPQSAHAIQGDLSDATQAQAIGQQALAIFDRVDVLINNASSFYSTPLQNSTEQDWDQLLGSNLKGPFFLTQKIAPALKAQQGCIINLVDIHAEKPLKDHPMYCIAKAGVAMMTKALAKELAPEVRVNGISPGAILWPEPEPTTEAKNNLLSKVPLQKIGECNDIVQTVIFLIEQAPYISGQIIAVDGGRSLGM